MPDHDGELEVPGSYFRWTVDTRKECSPANPLFSSTFVFQSNQWKLGYCIGNHQLIFLVKLSGGPNAPFDVTVHLEKVGTERILMEGLSDKKIYRKNIEAGVPKFVWLKVESDIVRSDPEFRRNNHELQFLVVLKNNDFLAGEECTHAACQFTADDDNVPSLESLSKDLGNLLDLDASADVEFRCEDSDGDILTTVKAHKLVVCARSPMIADMFKSNMVESRTNDATFRDIDAGVFMQLIKYLYSGKLDETTMDVDTAMSLYEAGNRFRVESLKKHCAKWLARNLTIENSCEVLRLADACCDGEFAEATLAFMVNARVPQVFDGWEDFCDRHPEVSYRLLDPFCKMFKGMPPEGEYRCLKR